MQVEIAQTVLMKHAMIEFQFYKSFVDSENEICQFKDLISQCTKCRQSPQCGNYRIFLLMILREINLGEFESCKTAVLTILGGSEFF